MTGALGITTVPLPAFWSTSSSKNEGEQLRGPFRTVHLCQNPRCAANKEAYFANTPSYKEPPAKRIKRPFRKEARSKSLSLVCSNKNSGTLTESENPVGIRALYNAAKCADCNADLVFATSTQQLPRASSTVNSNPGSTTMNSKGSTTPLSTRSYAPSTSTPTRRTAKPARVARAPVSSVQKRRSRSTRSCSPDAVPRRSQVAASASEREIRYGGGDEHGHIADSPQGGRVAPPPSESDEEDGPHEEIEQQHPLLTTALLPFYRSSLTGPASTSNSTCNWPSPTAMDVGFSNTRHGTRAPDSTTSKWASSLSTAVTTPAVAAIPQLPSDLRTTQMPLETWEAPAHNSLRHGLSKILTGTSMGHGRKPTHARKTRQDDATSAELSTLATMGNQNKVSVLEQNVEDDRRSNLSDSSDLTMSSDSAIESCSTKLCSMCGKNPVSSFYNALYTPDCTLTGTKERELDFYKRRRREDRKFRVAIKIAMLSVMVTLLVVVFSPLFMRELRSHLYGCCSCPAYPGTSASRNPSQHYSQLRSYGSWVDRGVRNLLKCPLAQQAMGSTVLK